MSSALNIGLNGSYTGGTDYSGKLVGESLRLVRALNGRSTLDFSLRGATSSFGSQIQPGKSLALEQPTGTTVFLGTIDEIRVSEVRPLLPSGQEITYAVSCIDLSSRLDRRLVSASWEAATVGSILDDLFADYLTAEDFSEGTVDSTIHNYVIDRLEIVYKPVRSVLNELAELTGASVIVNTDRTIDLRTRTAYAAPWDVNENWVAANSNFEADAPLRTFGDGGLFGEASWEFGD